MNHNDHEHHDPAPDGIEEHAGDDAAALVKDMRRSAERDGAPDPLDGLAERVRAEGEPVAFTADVVREAAALRAGDPHAFAALRAALKAAKVSVGRWDKALDAHDREAARAAKEACEREARAAAARAREAAEREAVEAAAQRERERAEAPAELAAHYGEASTGDDSGVTYYMQLGRVWMERPKRDGAEAVTLAHFSAAIVEAVHEVDAPDAPERVTYVVEVVLEGERTPRRHEEPAATFDRMRWPGVIAAGAAVGAAPGTREHLCEAIRLLSRGVTKHTTVLRFTGWDFRRRVYVTAGESIGERGAVEGVRAVPGDPADRYAFPPTVDAAEARAGVEALVALLSMEPATVMVPLVALAARSVLGPSRSLVHLMGPPGRGKSTVAALVAQCFGPSMVKERAPLAWDRVTPLAALHALATIGHAVVPIEDLRAEHIHKADPVLRAVFNGAGGMKGKREGGVRHEPRPRGSVLSTGEVRLPGESLNARTVTLSLDVHPTPRPDVPGGLCDRAARGELARGMAAFVRWLAPRVDDDFARIIQREREAARAWGLGASARAEEVLGALALGLEEFFSFLADVNALDAAALEYARDRAVAALRAVSREHGEHVAEEDPARRFCGLVGAALRSGEAHVAGIIDGRPAVPANPIAWGYRPEPSSYGTEYRPQGRRVGYVDTGSTTDEVLIEAASALDVARERAKRAGHPLSVDAAALARALKAAELLTRTDESKARRSLTVRARIGGGVRVDVLAVKVAALGLHEDVDDACASAPAPLDGQSEAPPETNTREVFEA